MKPLVITLLIGCLLSVLGCRTVNSAEQSARAQTPQSQFVYKSVGQRKLMINVEYPPGWTPADWRGAIVFFFGGSWTSGSPEQFRSQAEYLARRGMVCVRADYRVRSRDGVWPDKCAEDAASAVRWVRAHCDQLGVDPNRIVASGGSSGGHLAACTFFAEGLDDDGDGTSVSAKPNAMVLYNPPLDLLAVRGLAGVGDKLVVGLDDATLRNLSPSLHVRRDMPPTLILCGTSDFLYPQVRDFVERGKSLGAPVEGYFAEEQRHGFFNHAPWLERTTKEVDIFLTGLGYLQEAGLSERGSATRGR